MALKSRKISGYEKKINETRRVKNEKENNSGCGDDGCCGDAV